MNKEPHFRSLLRQLQDSDLPDWLRHAITCHDDAATALMDAPKSRQRELLPILEGSDAVICAHIHKLAPGRAPASGPDKIKLLKLRAKAIQVLAEQA